MGLKNNITISTLIVTIICLQLGCDTTAQSNGHKLIGVWKSNDNAKIILNQDSTFQGISLPSKLFFIHHYDGMKKVFNGFGRWEIVEWKFQFPTIKLDFDSTDVNKTTEVFIYVSGSGFWEYSEPFNTLFQWEEEEGGNRYKYTRQ